MAGKQFCRVRGMALMEVMMAVGIFAVVVGVTATSLSSFYTAIDAQQQRMEAVQSCRAVLGVIREKRAQYVTNEVMDRASFLSWIDASNTARWTAYLTSSTSGGLKDQTLSVTCYNMSGATAAATDTPIELHVISTWTDIAKRPMTAQVVTMLADR